MIKIFDRQWDNVVFDLDGVLLDSNFIKEENIYKAALQVTDTVTAHTFSRYFSSRNGVPREVKINAFFGENEIASKLLELYNSLNEHSLYNASIVTGALQFVASIKGKATMYVASGGSTIEINSLLREKKLFDFFKAVLGGPQSKEQNLSALDLKGQTLYFGDSLEDYKVALQFGFGFVFVYGYTQFFEWQSFFLNKLVLSTIKDFKNLII